MLRETLTTKRLLLRPAEKDDAERLAALLANWNVVRMLAMPPYPYTLDDAQSFLARVEGRRQDRTFADYLVEISDEPAGFVNISPTGRGPGIGYWLGETFWGRGYMTEALGAVIAEFFDAGRDDQLVSGVLCDNPASLAVQKKLGFEVVGESMVMCVPRGTELPHLETRLGRETFNELRS